jgi:hypothetical protein
MKIGQAERIQARIEKLSLAELLFIVKDTAEALEAMPEGENTERYAFEMSCASVLIARHYLGK